MAAPTLSPPPITTPLVQDDKTASPTWARWLQQLKDVLSPVTPWTTLTLQNSWVQYENPGPSSTFYDPQYMIDVAGFVRMRGLIKGGNNNTTITQLPAGARPSRVIILPAVMDDRPAEIRIDSSGSVILAQVINVREENHLGVIQLTTQIVNPVAWLSLDGVVFHPS